MELALARRLNEARAKRHAVAVITELADGAARLVAEDGIAGDPLHAQLQRAFRSGRSELIEGEGPTSFINMHLPPPRLVIIGAVHISQALVPMARLAGIDVEVIDPRTAFATPERFPETVLHADWPETILATRPLDAYTALAAVTHDPKIDDHALVEALRAGCFYVGALGSRKTHAKRVDRLRSAGLDDHVIDRIKAPIGLAIGAASPAEIAVAVLAQIIEALRTRDFETRPKDGAA